MNQLPIKKGKGLSFRNKYLALVTATLLLFSTCGYAQYDSTKLRLANNTTGFDFKQLAALGSFTLPKDTFKLARKDSGSIAYKNGNIYKYNGYTWSGFSSTSTPGIDSLTLHAGPSADTVYSWSGGDSTYFGLFAKSDGLNDVVTRNPQTTQPYMIVTNNAATLAVQKAGGFPGGGIVATTGYMYLKNASNKFFYLKADNLTGDHDLQAPDGDGTIARTSDTTGHWPTTMFRRSDSVFIVKGGIEVFAFKDSTGAGGGGSYTGSNGITLSTADFQLGGALSATTSITGSQTLNLGTGGSKLSSLNTNTSGNTGFVADGTISSTAPLVYLFGTDSTMILNLDETTDPIPALCRSSNGRLWWKTLYDTGRAATNIVTGYSLNKVRDSLQANIGAKVDTLSMGVSHLAADFTTSSTTAVNTGLSFYAAANTAYKVTIAGTASKATSSSGMKLAIGAPSGCTVKGFAQQGGATLSSALTNSLITAINTLGSTFATGTGVEVVFRIEATVNNGSTAGLITLDAATVTSNVATIYAQGTSMQWHKSTAQ